MKRLAVIGALCSTLAIAPAWADSERPPSISVMGEATVSVPPDLARIDAGVTSDAKTAREAFDANNAVMGKVLLALKNAGIDEKDYRTSRLSLQPQYGASSRSGAASSVTGFRASNRVTIKVRDVTKIPNVIDTVVDAGANDVGNISFEVSQHSKLLDDAREQALADARRKAEIYARAAGVAIGAPLRISERDAMAARVIGGQIDLPVATGQQTLSVTVNVDWAIKTQSSQ